MFHSISERFSSSNPDLERYRQDLPLYARECLKIRTRDLRLAPWEFNHVQAVLHEVAEKQRREKGYVRIIVAKRRRGGVSTYVQGRFYHMCALNPLVEAFTVAHEAKSTWKIFGISKLFQEENPVKHPVRYSSRIELAFENRSNLALATAGSPESARSGDITLLHASEAAYWTDADRTLTAIMACLPDPPAYSEVWLESTGNGFGNLFQQMVFHSFAEGSQPYFEKDGHVYAWKAPETDWVLVFFPWFCLPDAAKPFDTEDQKREFSLWVNRHHTTRDVISPKDYGKSLEKIHGDRHGLTLEQLHWRQWKLKTEYRDKLDDLNQEYPSTLLDAFKNTGGNVFPADLCDQLEKSTKPPIGEFTLVERSGKAIARRMVNGPLRIWEGPQQNADYLVTVDPAGGERPHQSNKNDPDWTVMDVWRRDERYLIQAAQYRSRPDYDLVGEEAILLARLFNRAAIAVLRMNHGLTVLAILRKEGWPRIVKDEDGEDGILETRKSKPLLVDALLRDARDGFIHINCSETVEEMRTFIERNKKLGSEDGCKDDRVSSAYAACYASERIPVAQRHSYRAQGIIQIGNLHRRHDAARTRERESGNWVVYEADD